MIWNRPELKSAFLRNFVVLMSGTALAQIITVLFMPVISRLYDEQSFGILGVFLSVAGIVGTISTLRYEMASMVAPDDEDSICLTRLSLLCVIAVAGLSAAIFLPLSGCISRITQSPELEPHLWWASVFILVTGIYATLSAWATRRKKFRLASISQIFRSLTVSATQVAAGICGLGVTGLIGGLIAGEICASLTMAAQVLGQDRRLMNLAHDLGRMKTLAKKYADFPLYGNTQCLIDAISQSVPVLLMASFFGTATVGLYSMGVRVLQLPMNLVLVSLRQVFFQKACEVYNQGGDTFRLYKRATLGLALIALGPVLIVILAAPPIFAFVLGEKWRMAGEYSRWLILWLSIMFFNVPSVTFYRIYQKQRVLLAQELSMLICRIVALAIGGACLDALQTVQLFSLVSVVFNVWVIAWMWRFLKRQAGSPAIALV
jgi:lipopolysaccharide exporter